MSSTPHSQVGVQDGGGGDRAEMSGLGAMSRRLKCGSCSVLGISSAAVHCIAGLTLLVALPCPGITPPTCS